MSWLVDTLLVTGALIALVLVLRRPVARWFGPGMAYALWLLPLLRLVLPPLVLPAPAVPAEYVVTAATVDAHSPSAAAVEPGLAVLPVLSALWLTGAGLFLAWRLGGYLLMRRRVLRAGQPVGAVGTVRLVESREAVVPVAFGVLDKVIALPPGFMAGPDSAERDLAIAHELEHHAGRDLALNFAMQPLLALHWFNPLAWFGWRALRRDQEAACDARVLAGRDPATREAYARLIARFARGPQPPRTAPMACAMLGEKSIVHRLRSLTMTEPTPRRRLAGRLLIGAAALALPLTASISYAASDEPTPPAAPPAPEAGPGEISISKVIVMPMKGTEGTPGAGTFKSIVLIDRQGGSDGDDSKLATRTVTRDGKTFVFKTATPLSDAEVEARIARIEKGVSISADSFEVAADRSAGGTMPRTVKRTMILRSNGKDGDDMAKVAELDGSQINCDAPDAKAQAEASADGQSVRVMVCEKVEGQALAAAADAVRKARESIAKDSRLSEQVRKDILKQLDEEIDRLSRKG